MSSSSSPVMFFESQEEKDQKQIIQLVHHRPHSARGSHAQVFLNLQKDKSDIIPVSVREAVAHISERKKIFEKQQCELRMSPAPHSPFSEMMRKEEEKKEAKRHDKEMKQQEKEAKNEKLWGAEATTVIKANTTRISPPKTPTRPMTAPKKLIAEMQQFESDKSTPPPPPRPSSSSIVSRQQQQQSIIRNNNVSPRKPPIPPRPQSSPEQILSNLILKSHAPEAIKETIKQRQFNADAAKFCTDALVTLKQTEQLRATATSSSSFYYDDDNVVEDEFYEEKSFPQEQQQQDNNDDDEEQKLIEQHYYYHHASTKPTLSSSRPPSSGKYIVASTSSTPTNNNNSNNNLRRPPQPPQTPLSEKIAKQNQIDVNIQHHSRQQQLPGSSFSLSMMSSQKGDSVGTDIFQQSGDGGDSSFKNNNNNSVVVEPTETRVRRIHSAGVQRVILVSPNSSVNNKISSSSITTTKLEETAAQDQKKRQQVERPSTTMSLSSRRKSTSGFSASKLFSPQTNSSSSQPPRPATASGSMKKSLLLSLSLSSSRQENNNNSDNNSPKATTTTTSEQEAELLRQANSELTEITNDLLSKTLKSRVTFHSLAAWAEASLQEALGAAHNDKAETEPSWVEEQLWDVPELHSVTGPGASSIATTLAVLNSIFTLDPAVSQTWGGIWLTIRNILLSGLFGTEGAFTLQKEMLRGMARFRMSEEESFARALCAVPSLTDAIAQARTRCAMMKKKILAKEEIIKGLDMALAKHLKVVELKRSFLVFRSWKDWAAKTRWQRFARAEFAQTHRNQKILKKIFDAWRRTSITLERVKAEQERDSAKMEAKHAKLILHKSVEDAKATLYEEVTTAKRHLAEERSLRTAQVSALTMETERLLSQREDLQIAVDQFAMEGRLWHNLWVEQRPRYDLFELPAMSTVVAKNATLLQECMSPLFARTLRVSKTFQGDSPLIAPQGEGIFEHQQHLQALNQNLLSSSPAAAANYNKSPNKIIASVLSPPAPLTAEVQAAMTKTKNAISKFLLDWVNAFLVSADYPRMVLSERDFIDGEALCFIIKEILKGAKELMAVEKYPRSVLDKIVFGIERIHVQQEPTPGHAVVSLLRIALDAFAAFPFFPPLLQVCPYAATHFTPIKILNPEFPDWWQYLLGTLFVMSVTTPASMDFVTLSTCDATPTVFTDAANKFVDQGLRTKIFTTLKNQQRKKDLDRLKNNSKNNTTNVFQHLPYDHNNNDSITAEDAFASEGLIQYSRGKNDDDEDQEEQEQIEQIPDDPDFIAKLEQNVTSVFGKEEEDETRLVFGEKNLNNNNNNITPSPGSTVTTTALSPQVTPNVTPIVNNNKKSISNSSNNTEKDNKRQQTPTTAENTLVQKKKISEPQTISLANRGTIPIQCLLGQHHFAHLVEGEALHLMQQYHLEGFFDNNSNNFGDDGRSNYGGGGGGGNNRLLGRTFSFMSSSTSQQQQQAIAFGTTVPKTKSPTTSTILGGARSPTRGKSVFNRSDGLLSVDYTNNNKNDTASSSQYTRSRRGSRQSMFSSLNLDTTHHNNNVSSGASVVPPETNSKEKGKNSPGKSVGSAGLTPLLPSQFAHLANSPMLRTQQRGLRSRNINNNNHNPHSSSSTPPHSYHHHHHPGGGVSSSSYGTIFAPSHIEHHIENFSRIAQEQQDQWRSILEKWQTTLKWENLFERDIAGKLHKSLQVSNKKLKRVPQTVADAKEWEKQQEQNDDDDDQVDGYYDQQQSPASSIINPPKRVGPLKVYDAFARASSSSQQQQQDQKNIHPVYRLPADTVVSVTKKSSSKKRGQKSQHQGNNIDNNNSVGENNTNNNHLSHNSVESINVLFERQRAWEQQIRKRAWYAAARLISTAIFEFHVLEWIPEQNVFRNIEICPIVREIVRDRNSPKRGGNSGGGGKGKKLTRRKSNASLSLGPRRQSTLSRTKSFASGSEKSDGDDNDATTSQANHHQNDDDDEEDNNNLDETLNDLLMRKKGRFPSSSSSSVSPSLTASPSSSSRCRKINHNLHDSQEEQEELEEEEVPQDALKSLDAAVSSVFETSGGGGFNKINSNRKNSPTSKVPPVFEMGQLTNNNDSSEAKQQQQTPLLPPHIRVTEASEFGSQDGETNYTQNNSPRTAPPHFEVSLRTQQQQQQQQQNETQKKSSSSAALGRSRRIVTTAPTRATTTTPTRGNQQPLVANLLFNEMVMKEIKKP